jgi:hypothetical protein
MIGGQLEAFMAVGYGLVAFLNESTNTILELSDPLLKLLDDGQVGAIERIVDER